MRGLVGAIQFLTRIPLRLRAAVPHEQALPWFPVVGALLGLLIGGAAIGLGELIPVPTAVAVAVIVGLLLTGAFHEDGLADIADAFGGGHTPERRFEILKDSRHGTYGVAALSGSIVLRVVAASSIVGSAALLAGFVAAHTLGRGAAVLAIAIFPPATQSGLGAGAARSLRPSTTVAVAVVMVGVTAGATGWWACPLIGGAIIAMLAVGWLAMRKIGGLAGDVLGAIEVVVECVTLVIVSGLALRYEVWWANIP